MKHSLTFLLVGFLTGGAQGAIAQSGQSPQTPAATFSLTLRAVNEVVEAGSPVAVEVTIKNNSNRLEGYPSWGPIYYRKFDVRDSGGKQPLTGRGRALISEEGLSADDFPSGSQKLEPIEPGKTITVLEHVPADLFDLSKPGTYTIQLHLPWGKQVIKSNTVTVSVIAGPTPYVEPVPQPPISVTIRTVGGTSVFPGGKLALEIVTKDISNHFTNQRTTRDKRDLARFFRVDVRDSQGAVPPETELGQASGNRGDTRPQWLDTSATGREDVRGGSYKPGEERTEVVAVNDLYDLSKPGQYTIQVRRWDDETKTWVKSNTITVTVTP